MTRGFARGASYAGALNILFALFAVASAQTINLQIILTGTPTAVAGFIQAVKPSDKGAHPSATSASQLAAVRLYGSPELMAAQLPTQGVILLPWKGPNPSGALLIFEDRSESIVIQNSNFWNLPAPALFVSNSSVTISNSSFDQNLRWGPRVAVLMRGASLYVSGTTFTNANCAADGGVIHASGGSFVALTNAVFTNNTAGGHGGAIYADTDSQLLSDASNFNNNSAGLSGGALYQNGFFPMMAGGDLGGIAGSLKVQPEVGANVSSYSASAFAMLLSNFTANRAALSGGAVYQEFATGSVKECQFVANSANLYGGALAQANIFGSVEKSTFQSNNALHGGSLFQQNVMGDIQQGTFSQNVAGATGGAVSRLLCTGNLNASSFANNAAEHGGSINVVRTRAAYISQNSFTGDQVGESGAGIYARSSVIGHITQNLFATMAASHGAGIYFEDTLLEGSIALNNFTDCVAILNGGGIDAVNSTLGTSVTENKLSGNRAGQLGAAVALKNTTATIVDNIFTNNLVNDAFGIPGTALYAIGGAVTSADRNVYTPTQGAFHIA